VSAPSPTSARTRVHADDRARQPPIAPFWQRLNRFFLFPFQREPLILAVLLSLAGYVALFPFLLAIPGILVIVLITARYAFKVAALASRGVLHSSEYTSDMMDPDWRSLPWALFGVLVVHGVIIRVMAHGGEALVLLANLLSSLLLPATVMVLIQTGRMLPALNPSELLATIAGIGKQYLLLWLLLFLLQSGMPQALALLLPVVPKELLIPAFCFIAIYFSWVMAAMAGYVMYQHHDALAIDLLKQPETAGHGADPHRAKDQQVQQRDARVADLVGRDQRKEALAQARDWVRTTEKPVADHRRYQRLLLLDDPVSGRLAAHTPRYIALLLAERQGPEALRALQAVQRKLPGFMPGDAPTVIALAEQAWKTMDGHATIGLLRSFDKRFPQAPEIPKAYELIVRALKQGLGRADRALPVYQAMLRHFPDHPCTQEARWVLREELAAGAA
jgi:hypothetical protein